MLSSGPIDPGGRLYLLWSPCDDPEGHCRLLPCTAHRPRGSRPSGFELPRSTSRVASKWFRAAPRDPGGRLGLLRSPSGNREGHRRLLPSTAQRPRRSPPSGFEQRPPTPALAFACSSGHSPTSTLATVALVAIYRPRRLHPLAPVDVWLPRGPCPPAPVDIRRPRDSFPLAPLAIRRPRRPPPRAPLASPRPRNSRPLALVTIRRPRRPLLPASLALRGGRAPARVLAWPRAQSSASSARSANPSSAWGLARADWFLTGRP